MDNFLIKNIVVKDGKALDFSYLKGRNIFILDLEWESRRILQSYPQYKKVRLVRVLPNTIFVDCVRRTPLVCVDANRRLYVDEDNVLYALPAQNAAPSVPVIVGLERAVFSSKTFPKNKIKELSYVLTIIKEANSVFKTDTIQKIYMTHKGQVDLFIPLQSEYLLREARNRDLWVVPEGMEVKIGFDDIKGKVKILAELLKQAKGELNNIEYIDLRFKEPVIKTRQK